jgi:hypothetical protein
MAMKHGSFRHASVVNGPHICYEGTAIAFDTCPNIDDRQQYSSTSRVD